MTTETEKAIASGKPVRIDVDVDTDEGCVMMRFAWDTADYERAAYTSREDGRAVLGLTGEDARELHRKLGAALGDPAHDEAHAERIAGLGA